MPSETARTDIQMMSAEDSQAPRLTPTGTAVLEVRGLSKRFPVGGLFKPKYVHALEKRLVCDWLRRNRRSSRRVGQRQIDDCAPLSPPDATH